MMTIQATADNMAPSLDPSMLPRTIHQQHLRKVSTIHTDEETVHLNLQQFSLYIFFQL